jgi:hypothetical protein
MVDTVLRHQGEAQAAREQRRRPIVPWTIERDFVDRYHERGQGSGKVTVQDPSRTLQLI